jgi:hypothetical protein
MPPEEAGYTYAVEPAATNRLLANEEESIYGRSDFFGGGLLSTHNGLWSQYPINYVEGILSDCMRYE